MSVKREPNTSDLPKTQYSTESFVLLAIVLVVGIFASTLPQPQGLGKIPLQNILKNHLHVPAKDTAKFFFYCGLFWYIKPLAGILTDAFPLLKTRRRYYILFSSALAAVAWVCLGFVKQEYGSLLLAAIIVNLFMVMMSTVIGAFLVEIGQSRGEVGKMTAVRQVAYNFSGIIQGPMGGFFAGLPLLIASGANAVLVISILPVAYFLMKEKPAQRNMAAFSNASRQIGVMSRSGSFWLSLLFIVLYYFSPGLGTLMYYRQNDVLHASQQTIGYLGSVGSIGAILSSFIYLGIAKRVNLKVSLTIGVVTAVFSTLLYVFYSSVHIAWFIDFQSGLFSGFAETALIDLAARGTPAGCEGLGYSLMMSARNVALFGADWLASALSDNYKIPWNTMVIVNAGTTAIVLVLLPFMPNAIMRSRDGQKPNSENTGEPAIA